MTIGHTIVGSGASAVIVCHGWFGDSQVFSPMVPFLDTESFRYVFMDFRGYGKSIKIKGDYSIDEIAHDAIELANTLNLEEFHLVGHSMGGKVIQRIAFLEPKRVISAVGITPVPAQRSDFGEDGLALFQGAAENDDNRRTIVDFMTGNRLSKIWIEHIVKGSRETTTKEAYAGYFDAWYNTDFSDAIAGLETPLQVLFGEHDLGLTERIMKNTFLKSYPNAELEMLPNCGHYPMQEAPVWLTSVIETYMHRQSDIRQKKSTSANQSFWARKLKFRKSSRRIFDATSSKTQIF